MCTALRDAGTPNGALRSPKIEEEKERRGQERRERGRGHFPGRHPSLCQSPAEGNRSKRKRRDLARDVRQEQIPRQSGGMCRRMYRQRDVQEQGPCTRSAVRGAGLGAAAEGANQQSKVILVGVKANRCFPNS